MPPSKTEYVCLSFQFKDYEGNSAPIFQVKPWESDAKKSDGTYLEGWVDIPFTPELRKEIEDD